MAKENSKRIVFLCSGGGGNLRFVKTAAEKGWLGQAVLTAVLTDRECGANEYARQYGLAEKSIDFTANGQLDLINSLDYYKPDIVITTVHRILSDEVVEKFRGRLINLHYSLLPAFGGFIGSRPVKEALAYGAKFVGVTVHMVDESLDRGKPLMQVVIPVKIGDDVTVLMELLFRCGCLSLGEVIAACSPNDRRFTNEIEEVLKIKNRLCLFSNCINLPIDIQNEAFWEAIK
jgi:phosphoribosylglycinamide formyltransferase-1